MEKYHHVVIGAGINGSCTAFQLAKRGTKVLLLEKFLLPHSRGSSHGQSRGIRKAYPDPFFTALMEEAYKEWEDIEEKTGVKLIKKTGLLCFAENKNIKFIKDTIDSFKKVSGAQNTVYNSKQLREKFPCVRLGKSALGCYDPSGGVIFADKALKCIQDLCKEYGVVIKDGEDVEDIKHNSNSVHISTTSGSRFTAQSCVICPGPWGGPLLAKLGYQVPLKPVKIPVYYWEAPDFLPHTWICEREDGKHFWGLPALEYPGLAKICPHDGPEIDPDSRDAEDTEHLKILVQDFVRTTFPGVNPQVRIEESCIYTITPDWNPIIDTLPGAPNIVVGVGFSGTGFKLGPVTGNMLADLAQGIKQRQDVSLLSYSRFSGSRL